MFWRSQNELAIYIPKLFKKSPEVTLRQKYKYEFPLFLNLILLHLRYPNKKMGHQQTFYRQPTFAGGYCGIQISDLFGKNIVLSRNRSINASSRNVPKIRRYCLFNQTKMTSRLTCSHIIA